MKYKKISTLVLCLLVICSSILTVTATENKVYSWYCKRNTDHKQPSLDHDLEWIKDYDGYYIDHAHNDTSREKVLYLTFDAGYENGNVEKILDVLQEEQVTGAFFILGHLIQSQPELVRRMEQDGHTVCNHTTHHPDMTTIDQYDLFQQELTELEDQYLELTGKPISKYYRPPEGKFDQCSLEFAKRMGYKTIFWSFAYADWDNHRQPSAKAAKAKIMDNLHNGAILLLHPTSETNAMILQAVIQECRSQGYRFGTLDELTATN